MEIRRNYQILEKNSERPFGNVIVDGLGKVFYVVEENSTFLDKEYPDRTLALIMTRCKDFLGRIVNFDIVDGKLKVNSAKKSLLPGVDSPELIVSSLDKYIEANQQIFEIKILEKND
jgi:hypothetical protein